MRQLLSRILLSLALLVGFSGAAYAVPTVYLIDTPNPAISGFTGPYASVSIDLTSATTADIVFTSLTNGGNVYLMGGEGAAGLNINGAYTLGAVVFGTQAGFNAPSLVSNSPGNEDGFGSFSLSLKLFDGFGSAANSISFTLTKNSGSWTSNADVLTANKNGAIAAVHAFVCALPCNSSTQGALATGYAATSGGGGPPVNIPEPQTLTLLGLGLVVLAMMRRRQAS